MVRASSLVRERAAPRCAWTSTETMAFNMAWVDDTDNSQQTRISHLSAQLRPSLFLGTHCFGPFAALLRLFVVFDSLYTLLLDPVCVSVSV
jgi:hypothetical protein